MAHSLWIPPARPPTPQRKLLGIPRPPQESIRSYTGEKKPRCPNPIPHVECLPSPLANTYTHTSTCMYIDSHLHACIHRNTYTHTHTHTHTHVIPYIHCQEMRLPGSAAVDELVIPTIPQYPAEFLVTGAWCSYLPVSLRPPHTKRPSSHVSHPQCMWRRLLHPSIAASPCPLCPPVGSHVCNLSRSHPHPAQ